MSTALKCAAVLLTSITIGCGPSRPDPRSQPGFDEATFNDPNVPAKMAPANENAGTKK